MKKSTMISMTSIMMLCIMMVVTLNSCGGSKKKQDGYTLSPDTTAVKGDLSDYYEVVSKEYTTSEGLGDYIVSVEVKRTDKEFDFDPVTTYPMGTLSEKMTGNAGFGIEILDENGNVIQKSSATEGGLRGMYSSSDMEEALKLKPGETASLRWGINFKDSDKPVKFRLTSAYKPREYTGNSSSESSSSLSSSSDNKWDSILDSYESYVNEYVKLYKKAQSGDISAVTEMASALEKAQELETKLSDAEADMTPSQAARLNKINSKLLSAM